MKTILYIQYFDPAAFPPLERSAQQFLDRGWRVHFLGIAPDGAYPKFADLKHPNLSVTFRSHTAGSLKDIVLFHLLALRLILRLKPRVVYVSQERVALIGLLATFLPSIRTVLHEHDDPFVSSKSTIGWLRKAFARRATICVIPQEERARQFQQDTGARNVAVIFNTPLLREIGGIPRRRARREMILWHHGSLGPSRLPFALTEALAACPDNVSLRFAGYETASTRGFIAEFMARAERDGVSHRVHFAGALDRASLYKAAAVCDVGVALFARDFPQPMAGASNKPFDFMSCGLPLLTTDSPEWRDFYANLDVSLFSDPDSAGDIAAKLRWFSDNPEARYEMARKSYDLIKTDWNYERSFAPVFSAVDQPGARNAS